MRQNKKKTIVRRETWDVRVHNVGKLETNKAEEGLLFVLGESGSQIAKRGGGRDIVTGGKKKKTVVEKSFQHLIINPGLEKKAGCPNKRRNQEMEDLRRIGAVGVCRPGECGAA